MRYTGVLAFDPSLTTVLLVEKTHGPEHLRGTWNGIGGKMEPHESPVGAARREFVEETKIVVSKDDLVYVEHQRFINGFDRGNEVYWYGVLVPNLLLYSERENDIGERLDLFDVSPRGFSETRVGVALSPNMSYLIPKAQRFLDLHYLDRPHPG